MGKGLDKFLNIMRLNDDDYDEDYDDYDEDDYDEDDYDDYDDFEEDKPAPVAKKKTFKKSEPAPEREKTAPQPAMAASSSRSSARSKIVPIKSTQRSGGMEVSVQKPTSFEDSRDICDVLLSGKAAVVNLEGIDVDLAQHIIDFISGACYAISGNIQKVSSYIFILTPENIDISGDIQEALSSKHRPEVSTPAFHLNV